jgi:transcriptional regulator with XRE-family HTH domain
MPASMFTDAYRVLVQCLVEARRDAGISQTELGRRMGKGQKFVSVIETGVRRIDLVEFVEWSRALAIDPATFFTRILARIDSD